MKIVLDRVVHVKDLVLDPASNDEVHAQDFVLDPNSAVVLRAKNFVRTLQD